MINFKGVIKVVLIPLCKHRHFLSLEENCPYHSIHPPEHTLVLYTLVLFTGYCSCKIVKLRLIALNGEMHKTYVILKIVLVLICNVYLTQTLLK